MKTYEIKDPDAARHYLIQSLCLSRGDALTAARAAGALRWALELASEGAPVPLLGFVCDFGHFLNQTHLQDATDHGDHPRASDEHPAARHALPSDVDRGIARRYEDYVIGKLYADLSLERAVDALQKYSNRDRDRAIAFALSQVCERSSLNGALVGPAVIKGLLALNAAELTERLEAARGSPVDRWLIDEFEQLIQAVRNTGELLGAEDIFELERGTALSQFGQRMALRQVLQAADYLATALPKQKPRGAARQYSVATNIHQEDYYPVGGFTSISNRGTLESLLRSELAYMDVDQRPDLFDIKYVRDELLYYSRDDNRFFRRRVCFMFVMTPELVLARVKDDGANWQRIIYTLALIVAAVRSLTEWLSADALRFEILFDDEAGESPLADERLLLETIFHEEIRSGSVEISSANHRELLQRSQQNAKQALCHCTLITASANSKAMNVLIPAQGHSDTARSLPLMSVLSLGDPRPTVQFDDASYSFESEPDPWRAALACLIEAWL
ncbi:MAG: hypothetical protein ACTHK7_18865 [Aureliella sp.]